MEERKYKKLSWYPILAVGLSMASFIMIKSARDAVFFQKNGIFNLPMAYIWISLAAIPVGMVHLNTISKFGARKTRIIVYLFSSALFAFLFPFVEVENRIMMLIMFILIPIVFAALFAGAWLLAGDLLEGASQEILRNAYSRIGAGSMIGGIIGGIIARQLSGYIPTKILVLFGAATLILVVGLFLLAHKRNPLKQFSSLKDKLSKQNSSDKPNSMFHMITENRNIFKEPYVLTIIAIGTMTSITGLYIDFQFYAKTMMSHNNNLQFFASFYIILNALSLLLQLFVAPRLQYKFGIAGALTLLPVALLGVSGIFTFWTFAQSRVILKVTEGGLKSSIHRSIWEQVFLPIDRNKRAGVKAVVDGTVARVSEGIGALVLYFWLLYLPKNLNSLNLEWISWMILGIIIVWIILNHYLKRLGCNEIDSVETRIRLPDS
jgi:AAA family ATP:ADP antiporter